jgi:hypothetical protein
MNKEKYARLTVVLDLPTDAAIRRIANMTDQSVSNIVRDLISEPAMILATSLEGVLASNSPDVQKAALAQLEMFVESQYGEYLQLRGGANG